MIVMDESIGLGLIIRQRRKEVRLKKRPPYPFQGGFLVLFISCEKPEYDSDGGSAEMGKC
jgi:hypothetical protein